MASPQEDQPIGIVGRLQGLFSNLRGPRSDVDLPVAGSKNPDAKVPPSTTADVPGKAESVSTKLMDKVEGTVQNMAPINKICQHLAGFHCYAHDISRQVVAHHYCSHLNDEVRQCIIYDSDKKNARLIGIEYVISARLFEALPPEEHRFWHSHKHEVMSGSLIAPEIPELVERTEMQDLVGTYGKTIHTWQIDNGDSLPLGPPQLMMSFTEEGQLEPGFTAARDATYGTNTAARKDARMKHIKAPNETHPNADQPHKSGKGYQLDLCDTGAFRK